MYTKRRVRKTITRCILEKLSEAGEGMLDVMFPLRGGFRRFRSVMGAFNTYPRGRVTQRTFTVLLSRLKTEGLIEKSGRASGARWRLTKQGEQKIGETKKRELLPKKDGIGRLVIFDIPEKERSKRRAIRVELLAAGFTQLQKSVWIGHAPLPEDFLTFLDVLRVRNHVHIFSIRDRGTIQKT